MDQRVKNNFITLWKKYFKNADLPIVFQYTDDPGDVKRAAEVKGHRCLLADLAKVRKGTPLSFNADNIGCGGGTRYLGFSGSPMPNFEYFLSCGIPGKLEGERYKKSPELVLEGMKHFPAFTAPKKHIVFKRWDAVDDDDEPEVVIFFAKPDVLSGLFTLANFDESESNVFTPMAAGCGSIVLYPYLEKKSKRPRSVIGMFDVSARPFVPEEILSFSTTAEKFHRMIENTGESFLTLPSWGKIKKRI